MHRIKNMPEGCLSCNSDICKQFKWL